MSVAFDLGKVRLVLAARDKLLGEVPIGVLLCEIFFIVARVVLGQVEFVSSFLGMNLSAARCLIIQPFAQVDMTFYCVTIFDDILDCLCKAIRLGAGVVDGAGGQGQACREEQEAHLKYEKLKNYNKIARAASI